MQISSKAVLAVYYICSLRLHCCVPAGLRRRTTGQTPAQQHRQQQEAGPAQQVGDKLRTHQPEYARKQDEHNRCNPRPMYGMP